VAVGVVVADPGDGLDALEVLRRQDTGDDRLDLVVDALEGPLGVRHRLLDALLGRAVPREPRRAEILCYRTQRQPDAGRDAAQNDLDLILQHELSIALDRVLGIAFLLDHELHRPPEDAASPVHALRPPLGGAGPRGADRRGDAGADREDADLHGAGP